MLTLDEVCKTILGQMGSKIGFLGKFFRVSREGTKDFEFPRTRCSLGE